MEVPDVAPAIAVLAVISNSLSLPTALRDYLCLFCASSVGIQNRVYQHLSIFSERGETGT